MWKEDQTRVLFQDRASTTPKFHCGSYLVSQWLWQFFIYGFLALLWIVPNTAPSGKIESADAIRPWNNSEDPFIVGHLTDVHVNSVETEKNFKFTDALSNYMSLGVKSLVITGDLVDNWGHREFVQYGHQYEDDYKLYYNITNDRYKYFDIVVDMAGNHDEFGLFKFDTDQHFFMKYSSIYSKAKVATEQQFWAQTFTTNEFVFVSLNPYRFPTPHAKFDYWARQTTELLDVLEKELSHAQEARKQSNGVLKPLLIGCHYPMNLWVMKKARSSTGKTFEDLIVLSNPNLFISGHTHPSHSQLRHHNGTLEVIGVDLVQHDGYSIISFDNGRQYHQSYNIKDIPDVILTHPIPVKSLSRNIAFSEKDTSIRLLGRNDSLKIKVSGAVSGEMKCVRQVKSGWYLYSLPMTNLDDGFHIIEFSGDWNHKVEFYIGKTIFNVEEEAYGSQKDFTIISVFCALFFIANIIILFPVRLNVPFRFRDRLFMLPDYVRYVLTGALLAPFILPISFIDIEGVIGVNFWYGYYINGHLFYDIWGQIMVFFVYQAGIVFASCIFASSLVASKQKWHPIFILDYCYAFAGLGLVVFAILTGVTEASGLTYACLSPLYVFVPVVVYGTLITWRLTDKSGTESGAKRKLS